MLQLLIFIPLFFLYLGSYILWKNKQNRENEKRKITPLYITLLATFAYYSIAMIPTRFSTTLIYWFPLVEVIKHIGLIYAINALLPNLTKHPTLNKSWYTIIAIISISMLVSMYFPIVMGKLIYPFGGFFLVFVQLWLVERVHHAFKNANTQNPSLIFALTLLSIVDLVSYTQTVFNQQVSIMSVFWFAFVSYTVFPFLSKGINAFYIRRLPISLSRPVAFQSSILFLASAYLFGVSIIGYLLDNNILVWSTGKQLVVLILIILPMTSLFLSDRIRREIWVFVNKHFYATQFDYKKTWSELIKKLDPKLPLNQAYKVGLDAALSTINFGQGAYYHSNNHLLSLAATKKLILSEQGESELVGLQAYLSTSQWIIDVDELCNTSKNNLTYQGSLCSLRNDGVRWIVPVMIECKLKGIWLLSKPTTNVWRLNWETRDFLFTVVEQLYRYFDAQKEHQLLSEHEQLITFHKTSAFVIHDSKNILSQIDMILTNAQTHRGNKEFVDDVFVTLSSIQTRMKKMLTQLNNKNIEIKQEKVIELRTLLQDIVDTTDVKNTPPPQLDKRVLDTTILLSVDPVKLTNVIKHLIDNAQYACRTVKNKKITINCFVKQQCVNIVVSDNGVGMSEEFIETRLFKPFDTTKGNSGMGLGVYDAKTFAENLNGTLRVNSNVNKGTTFTLMIPKGVDDDECFDY